jgi:hypothetical protein
MALTIPGRRPWDRLVELRGQCYVLSQYALRLTFLGWQLLDSQDGTWPTHQIVEFWQDPQGAGWICTRNTTQYGGLSVHRRTKWQLALAPPGRLQRQQELIGRHGFCTSLPIDIPVYGDHHESMGRNHQLL